MYGAVEGVVLREDEEDDEGHVHMMRVSLLDMIQDLKNRQHLQRQKEKIFYYGKKKKLWSTDIDDLNGQGGRRQISYLLDLLKKTVKLKKVKTHA